MRNFKIFFRINTRLRFWKECNVFMLTVKKFFVSLNGITGQKVTKIAVDWGTEFISVYSSISSFVWKPAHFEVRSYGGTWHNANKIPFVISEWGWWILSSVIKCEIWNIQHDTSVGQRKIWVPDRNRTHDLPNTGRALYPLSYENSWRARISLLSSYVSGVLHAVRISTEDEDGKFWARRATFRRISQLWNNAPTLYPIHTKA